MRSIESCFEHFVKQSVKILPLIKFRSVNEYMMMRVGVTHGWDAIRSHKDYDKAKYEPYQKLYEMVNELDEIVGRPVEEHVVRRISESSEWIRIQSYARELSP